MTDSGLTASDVLRELREAQSESEREESFRAALRFLERQADAALDHVPKSEQANQLREVFGRLRAQTSFSPGDIVTWKPAMRNRRRPRPNEVAIVVEHLSDPRFDKNKEAGSPVFYEPLDLIIGFLDEDGDFIMYHVDSRRFEIWEEEGDSEPDAGEAGVEP